MMKKITEAYEILSNTDKRKEYNNKIININSCTNSYFKSTNIQLKKSSSVKREEIDLENWLEDFFLILMFKYNGDIETFIKEIFINFGYDNNKENNSIKQKNKVKKDK